MLALRARYVLPIEAPPIEHGVVVVEGSRIVEVGVGSGPPGTIDLGHAALLPGLVNAHTHLEFSRLTHPLGQAGWGFCDWITAVVQWRRGVEETSPAPWRQAAVRAGLDESLRAGVTTLADVITFPWPADAYQGCTGSVLALAEYLGPTQPRASQQWQWLRACLSGAAFPMERGTQGEPPHSGAEIGTSTRASLDATVARTNSSAEIAWGVSPHAPYTVRWDILTEVCDFAQRQQMPVAMHLAESREEIEYLRSGSGPLRDLLQRLGAWDPAATPSGRSPRDYLEVLSSTPRALVVHGNFLNEDEIRFLGVRREQMAAVYCPRTHGYFAHGQYPLAEMLSAGARVALGTDSRASAPDLQLLEELRYVARNHPDIPPEVIVELGTLSGATALGRQSHAGSLVPGKQADLVVIGLAPSGGGGPYSFLRDPNCRIERVYRAGKEVAGPTNT